MDNFASTHYSFKVSFTLVNVCKFLKLAVSLCFFLSANFSFAMINTNTSSNDLKKNQNQNPMQQEKYNNPVNEENFTLNQLPNERDVTQCEHEVGIQSCLDLINNNCFPVNEKLLNNKVFMEKLNLVKYQLNEVINSAKKNNIFNEISGSIQDAIDVMESQHCSFEDLFEKEVKFSITSVISDIVYFISIWKRTIEHMERKPITKMEMDITLFQFLTISLFVKTQIFTQEEIAFGKNKMMDENNNFLVSKAIECFVKNPEKTVTIMLLKRFSEIAISTSKIIKELAEIK